MWAALPFSNAIAYLVFRPLVTVYFATFYSRVAWTMGRIFSPGLSGTALFTGKAFAVIWVSYIGVIRTATESTVARTVLV